MLCTIIAWAGLLVAALAINPGWLENAYLNRFQNLVSFLKSKDISEVFLGYMILAVLSVFIQILGMLKASQPAKVRIFGRKFLEILVLNIVGIFFDQLFPKYSYLGFPGGVLTQFWGMLIMWDAVKSLEDVHIDAKNLADKLSKIDGAPVLVYGGGGGLAPKDAEEERKKLQYANEAAQQYFNMNSQAPLENYSMNNLFEDVMNNYDRVADNVPDAYLAKRVDKDEYCYLQVNDLKDRYNDSVASMVRINEIPNQEEARQTWENWQSARKEATQELETARTLTKEAKEARDTFNSLIDEAKHSRDTFNSLANEARQSINHSELLADEARQSIKKAEQFSEDARNTERYYRAKLNHEFDTTTNPLSAIWTPKNGADFSAPRYSSESPLKENFSREKINESFGKEIAKPGIRNEFAPKENFGPSHSAEGATRANAGSSNYTESTAKPAPANFAEGIARHNTASSDFIGGVAKHNTAPADFTDGVARHNTAPGYPSEGITKDKANLDGTYVRGTRALIASQNETERNALAQILQSYGIKVDTASNARDTMKMCKDKNYTLLFMDENIPAMNGAKTLGKIRGINDFYQDTCKILALSGSTPEVHKSGPASPSFDGYIEGPAKEVNVQMLLNYFLPKDKFSEGTSFSDLKGPEVTVSKNIDDLRASFQASKAKKSIETPQTEKPFLENTVSTVNVDSPVSSINEVEDIEASPAFGEVSHFVGNDVDSIDIPSADELFKAQEAENEGPAPAKVSPLENSKPSSKFEELLNEERSQKVTKEHPSINDDYEDDDDLEDEDMEIASEEDPENPEKEGDKVDYDNLRDFKKIIPEVQREKAPKDNEKSDLQPVKKHKK